MALTFAFNANDPRDIDRQRELAKALMDRIGRPQSIGEGIGAALNGFGAMAMMSRANKAEAAGRQTAAQVFANAIRGGKMPKTSGARMSPGATSAPAITSGGTLDGPKMALLDTIAGTESAGKYNVLYGGKTFDDMSRHPGIYNTILSGPNKGKKSSASGKYQFLESTWNNQAKKLGLKDFSPASQDQAAWDLAATTYRAKTGRDIMEALGSGDKQAIAGVGKVLNGVWTSLPSGIEAGTNEDRFVQAFQQNMGRSSPKRYGNLTEQQMNEQIAAKQYLEQQAQDNHRALRYDNRGMRMDAMTPDEIEAVNRKKATGSYLPQVQPASAPGAGSDPFSGLNLQQRGNAIAPIPVNDMPEAPGSMPMQSPQQMAQQQPQMQPDAFSQSPEIQSQIEAIEEALSNPWLSDTQQKLLVSRLQNLQEQSDPMRQLELRKYQLELEQLQNPRMTPYQQQQLELEKRKLDFDMQRASQPKAPDPTDDMREYEMARQQGYKGTLRDWIVESKKAGASNTTVTVGGEVPDGELRKSLDKSEGDSWIKMKESALVSGGNAQDFAVLDELVNVAPQGPITGRLATAFPGVSSAGDAFNSIVLRIAPTLRTPGSGATSDIEYDGMVRSLPSLKNQPDANKMILSVMRAKADLNVQRGEVITAYQSGEISASFARKELAKLNKISIITPEMKKAMEGLGAQTQEPAPNGAPQPGAIVDGYRYKGGDPANQNSWEQVQ